MNRYVTHQYLNDKGVAWRGYSGLNEKSSRPQDGETIKEDIFKDDIQGI